MTRHQIQFLDVLRQVQGRFPSGLRQAFARWLREERRIEREKWLADVA
jgi:hypothetical protein